MSTSARNVPKSRFVTKHFSLRFKHNNGGLKKSNSCRSFTHEKKESYLNVSNTSGRYVLSDESSDPHNQSLTDDLGKTANRSSALLWARRKISQLRDSIRKRNKDVFNVEECRERDDNQEHDDSLGAYVTADDCYSDHKETCDEILYSRKISPKSKSVSTDNLRRSSRLQGIGQRFFIVRWMATKFLQFRERRLNTPRTSSSVYEKARAIFETSDDSSLTSSNAEDPVYMDASLADAEMPAAISNAEPARESKVYFELEPDQRYEIVILDNTSKPVLAGAATMPSQYAKLGVHEKGERGNIYGDLSSAQLDDSKKKTM